MEHQQRTSPASNPRKRLGEMAVLAFIIAMLPRDSHAYIDPGSGALVVQAVLSGFFGLIFMGRKVLKATFGRLFGSKEPADTTAPTHPSEND